VRWASTVNDTGARQQQFNTCDVFVLEIEMSEKLGGPSRSHGGFVLTVTAGKTPEAQINYPTRQIRINSELFTSAVQSVHFGSSQSLARHRKHSLRLSARGHTAVTSGAPDRDALCLSFDQQQSIPISSHQTHPWHTHYTNVHQDRHRPRTGGP
jgi:hypothetical protein